MLRRHLPADRRGAVGVRLEALHGADGGGGAGCGELLYAVDSGVEDDVERCELCCDGGVGDAESEGLSWEGLGEGNAGGGDWVGLKLL